MTAFSSIPVATTSVAYLALGSNQGRREQAVLRAVRAIAASGVGVVKALSSLYETEPVDMPHARARRFVNAVVAVETLLSPEELLQRVKGVEADMGRSGGHFEPREIDVDIIACGDWAVHTPDLTIPHPRYAERAFVLVPLRDVAPEFRCPRSGAAIDELVSGLARPGGVVRISSRGLVSPEAK